MRRLVPCVAPLPQKQDDVVAGWVIGAASASLAVRWVVFPEAFWRGAGGGDDRLAGGVHGTDNLQSLRENGGFQLMMGSQNGSDVDVRDEVAGGDVGVVRAGGVASGDTMASVV